MFSKLIGIETIDKRIRKEKGINKFMEILLRNPLIHDVRVKTRLNYELEQRKKWVKGIEDKREQILKIIQKHPEAYETLASMGFTLDKVTEVLEYYHKMIEEGKKLLNLKIEEDGNV